MPDIVPDPVPPTPPVPPVDGKNFLLKFVANNWQKFVSFLALVAVTTVVNFFLARQGKDPLPQPPVPVPVFEPQFGWIPPTDQERQETLLMLETPYFADTPAGKEELVGDDDTSVFLWNYTKKVRGKHIPTRNQGRVGSCVSFGWGTGIEYALAVQTVRKRGPAVEQIDVAQEVIYGGSRTEGRGARTGGLGDGSTGAWMVKYVSVGGIIARGKYGEIDLTSYSETRCKEYGFSGVPSQLKPIAKKNLVKGFALVRSSDEARKAIQQGYPIPVCSNVGFGYSRDAEGFMRPGLQPWPHCMCLIGYNGGTRPGFYCLNSWGENWASGAYGVGEPPPGGFWIDASIVDRMMRQQDSYAISQVTGFPKQKLTADDWTRLAPRPQLKLERMFANGFDLAP